jgi:hypothetical protein
MLGYMSFLIQHPSDMLFPLPSIPPIAPHSSSIIIGGWYNKPVVTSVPLHPRKGEKNNKAAVLNVLKQN